MVLCAGWMIDLRCLAGRGGADRGLGALRGRRQAVEQRRRVGMHHLRILREGLLAAPLGDDGIGEPAQEADDAGRVADPTGCGETSRTWCRASIRQRTRRAYSRGVSARLLMW